jgi:hypothetical protein
MRGEEREGKLPVQAVESSALAQPALRVRVSCGWENSTHTRGNLYPRPVQVVLDRLIEALEKAGA